MKITQIEPIILRLPQVTEDIDGTQDDLLIRVETDEGLVGWGEVDSSPEVARAAVEAHASHGIAHGLREILIGRDPFDIEQLWDLMYRKTFYFGRQGPVLHAMSGIDIALWDILGKAINKPVHKLLGGSYRTQARAYASVLMPQTPAAVERLAREQVAQGYTAMKFGWGPLGSNEDRDVELIAAARSGAGDAELMIDIGQKYTVKQAIRVAERIEKYRLNWLEEPLPPDDFEGYKRLTATVPINIAAGEAESGHRAFRRLIEECRLDVIQPDISRVGGLTEVRKVATLVEDANARLVPHAFKTGILLSACLHLIAALPKTELLEYSLTNSPIRNDLLLQPIRVVQGYVQVPEKPGLGIEINPEVVARYRVV
ncbi:MAG TPA: mandelate racemase/muconate lactonizing enzyme family protein [Terriglobia bacterium]|nr:mandelate racemase/muconate lactonizing enzyme family protein [Terriglobia bacterium]